MKNCELIGRVRIDDRHPGNGPTTPKMTSRTSFHTASAKSGHSPGTELEPNMVHYWASMKADIEEMFDGPLGKTNWMITAKEHVKLVTLFLDDGLLIFSLEVEADHDDIIKQIQNMNLSL